MPPDSPPLQQARFAHRSVQGGLTNTRRPYVICDTTPSIDGEIVTRESLGVERHTLWRFRQADGAAARYARGITAQIRRPALVFTAQPLRSAAAPPRVAHNVDCRGARRTPADTARPRGRAPGTRAPSGPRRSRRWRASAHR